jgi:hypothetical protein
MMPSSSNNPGCGTQDLSAALGAFADGELDPGSALAIGTHMHGCAECTAQMGFLRALRASLRRAAAPRCPATLRARVASALARERKSPAPRLIPARYAAAAAAACGVVLALAASRPEARQPAPAADPGALGAASMESVLDDLVALHAQPLPPETTDPEDLPRFDQLVGVPVRRPAFHPLSADYQGARVHAMRDRRAALLQYTLAGGRRMTVYVFDSRRVRVQDAPALKPRRVQERPGARR